jgi:hypothetical protein
MIEWLRARVWWHWVVAAFVLLVALDLLLMATHSGSVDPTDPSNRSSQSHDTP